MTQHYYSIKVNKAGLEELNVHFPGPERFEKLPG